MRTARQLRGPEPHLQDQKQATALEVLLGNMAKAAESATQAAGEAADNWINSGWQVQSPQRAELPLDPLMAMHYGAR